MPDLDFYATVKNLLQAVYHARGIQLDVQLSGRRITDALHVNIDPAINAIVQTELQIGPRLKVDLRELEDAAPPFDSDNLFITFSANSANFQGGNVTAFGIHMTKPQLSAEVTQTLEAGIFLPATRISDIYQMIVFVQAPSGDVQLARTGMAIGLDPDARLVSYLAFESDRGLAAGGQNPPSRLANADRQVVLYIFLALSTFMAVNQGEAPVRWITNHTAVIG